MSTQITPRVKPHEIDPLPCTSFYQCSDNEENKSRRGSAALITGTPYKDALEASLAEQKRKKSLQEKVPKLKVDKKSVVHQDRTNKKGKALPNKKMIVKFSKKCKKQESTDSSEDDEELVLDDDSDMDCDVGEEDAEYLFCCGLFSEDNAGENWIKLASAITVHGQEMEKAQSEIIVNVNTVISIAAAAAGINNIFSCTENFANTMIGSPLPERMGTNQKMSFTVSESQLTDKVMEPGNIGGKNIVNAMETEGPDSDDDKSFNHYLLIEKEHRIDSPFDDSDIDPNYDPAEEINTRAGKRKKIFFKTTPPVVSGTDSEVDIRVNNGDDPPVSENERKNIENIDPKYKKKNKRARTEKEKSERI